MAMMYHLGWFLAIGAQGSVGSPGWNPTIDGPWAARAARDAADLSIYSDLARMLDQAGFDFILFQDNCHISDNYGGSPDMALMQGIGLPKFDPMPLLPVMAAASRHVGLVPSISSTFYPPFLAARLLATLDVVTQGRLGFNLITSLYERAYQNFGIDHMPPKEERYERASEWIDLVRGLHASWEPGAYVADAESGMLVDPVKVHRLDHQGKYFKCRGPLNTMPGPQSSHIPMVEAGNSPTGRNLAARHADSIMCAFTDMASMKAF